MTNIFGLLIGLVLIIAIFYVVNEWHKNMALLRTVTDGYRGTKSERKLILQLLKHDIPPVTLYHDLYVERQHGRYSQIDAVLVTRVGIIVFEVKDYSGWIFGKGYQNQWTQVLAYGKEKYRFYNPILQNNGHIEALKTRLEGVADVPFYSVIVFYGGCTLRDVSYIPKDTFIGYAGNVMSVIEGIICNNPPVNYKDKWGVINVLREAVTNGDNCEIVNQHIQNVRKVYIF